MIILFFGIICVIVNIRGVILCLFFELGGILLFKSCLMVIDKNLLEKFDIIRRCKIEFSLF